MYRAGYEFTPGGDIKAISIVGIGPLITIHRGLHMGQAMTKSTQSQTSCAIEIQ
jgi:hypothetical protein